MGSSGAWIGPRTSPWRDDLPVPLLDLKAQYSSLRREIKEALDRVIGSQQFILGPEVAALEEEIAKYCSCQFAVGVSSGTDALLLSLMAVDIRPGDEVITTPYTFFATAGAIARLGATPVFVDIDPRTYNINPTLIASAVSSRTRAIIPVHLFGQMADMNPILELADQKGLHVIEDAAQAIGADYKTAPAGSLGTMACFSFFPSKNLGAFGDGGMITTNDAGLAARLRLLRNHGFSPKYHSSEVGGNFRLDAIQAAVLRVKLKYLDGWTEERRTNAERYRQLFRGAGLSQDEGGKVLLPFDALNGRHVYNQFVVRVLERPPIIESLKRRKVGFEVYYPVPMHLQECFAALGHTRGDFPESEGASQETLAIPIYPEIPQEHQEIVVTAITDGLK